jgi:uncharacterized delta-60 repeat protein
MPTRTHRLLLSFLAVALAGLSQASEILALSPDTAFRAPFFVHSQTPERALVLADGKYLLYSFVDTLLEQPTGPITRFLPDGTLDTTFVFSREYKHVKAAAAAPGPDGKLYVAATRYLYGLKETDHILRLNADGSIDPSFAPVTVSSPDGLAFVWNLYVQPDAIFAIGYFTDVSGVARTDVVRLLPDGMVDPTFVPPTLFGGEVYSLAVQPNGRILIAGSFSDVNGTFTLGIARLQNDGSVDSSFQASGFVLESRIRALVIQDDGKIVMSGRFRLPGRFAPRGPLLRIDSNGALDTTFTVPTNVPGPSPMGRDLVRLPDAKFVGAIGNSIYRFNSNGSLDSDFHSPYFPDANLDPTLSPGQTGSPFILQLQSDGRFFVGGNFTDVDPPGVPTYSHFGVARLEGNGTLVSTFTTQHKTGVETAPDSFARLSDGSTWVAFADKVEPPMAYNLGRLLPNGSIDPSFALTSSDSNSFLSSAFRATGLERLPDGDIFVFGTKGLSGFAYGKFEPNGQQDNAFATDPGPAFAEAIASPDGKVLLSAANDAQAMVYGTLNRLGIDGHREQFEILQSIRDQQVIRDINTGRIFQMFLGTKVLAVQPDGKILFEYFAPPSGNIPSNSVYHLVRLNTDGSIDGSFAGTTFAPTGLTESFPVIFDPVIGGAYQPPDGAWSATLPVRDAHILPDGRIVLVGPFKSYNGMPANGMVRLAANGTLDSTFNVGNGPQWTQSVATSTFFPHVDNVEGQDEGKLLLTGSFEAFNGVPAPGIARLHADGSVDTSFTAPASRDKRSRPPTRLERQADGSFLLSGPYTFPNGSLSPSLIRLVELPPMAVNVSTRLGVGTGDDVLIEGFIVQGPPESSKKIMVRAIGPSLGQFGIGDALANPTLEIRDSSNALVAMNNDWKTTQIGGLITSDQVPEITASQLAPGNDLESAIIANLAPGSYTAVVRGAGNTAGTGLVDAFDLSPSSAARLANVATRGLIKPGDGLMIAGFIVQNGPINVVVRGIGPSLGVFGISNALPDTTLQLRDQNGGIVLENDDWKTGQRQELEAIGLQPSHDLEAALITTIQPGQYTAQVRGKGQASGIGVVEVYFPQ